MPEGTSANFELSQKKILDKFYSMSFETDGASSCPCNRPNGSPIQFKVTVISSDLEVKIKLITFTFVVDERRANLCKGLDRIDCLIPQHEVTETIPNVPVNYWRGSKKTIVIRTCWQIPPSIYDLNVTVTAKVDFYVPVSLGGIIDSVQTTCNLGITLKP